MEVAIFQSVRFDFDLAARGGAGDCCRLASAALLVGTRVHADAAAAARAGSAARSAAAGCGGAECASSAMECGSRWACCSLDCRSAQCSSMDSAGRSRACWARRVFGARPALSVALALGASALSLILGICLSLTLRHLRFRRYVHRRAAMMEAGGSLMLVVPPLALGTGTLCAAVALSGCIGLGAAVRGAAQRLPLPSLCAAQPGGADAADHGAPRPPGAQPGHPPAPTGCGSWNGRCCGTRWAARRR